MVGFIEDIGIPQTLTQIASGVPDSDVDCPAHTRGLLVEAAGTVNVRMAGSGNTDLTGVPLQQGWNPGAFTTVKSGGTASNIWAIT